MHTNKFIFGLQPLSDRELRVCQVGCLFLFHVLLLEQLMLCLILFVNHMFRYLCQVVLECQLQSLLVSLSMISYWFTKTYLSIIS